MKKIKKGFSLAEVLLASIIAAIIATIGFSLAKKGIENAYKLYVYTGYNAMSIAINDAVNKGLSIYECTGNEACDFIEHISELLSYTDRGLTDDRKDEFKTPNGITYTIYRYGTFSMDGDDEDDIHYEYRIAMTVPSVKTKTSSTKRICMSYQPDRYKGMLIPFGWDAADPYCRSSDMIKDIASRPDLLAFYFDDGWRGKVVKKDEESTEPATYQKRYFRSADEILCQLYRDKENNTNNPIKSATGNIYDISTCNSAISRVKRFKYDWQDFEKSATEDTIIIRIADPRRA